MEGRQPCKTTDTTQRARMVWMWVGGQSARSIARETGASVSTVYRWIRRWEQEGNVHTRPRVGKYHLCFWGKKVVSGAPCQDRPVHGMTEFCSDWHRHPGLESVLDEERQPYLNSGFGYFTAYYGANGE